MRPPTVHHPTIRPSTIRPSTAHRPPSTVLCATGPLNHKRTSPKIAKSTRHLIPHRQPRARARTREANAKCLERCQDGRSNIKQARGKGQEGRDSGDSILRLCLRRLTGMSNNASPRLASPRCCEGRSLAALLMDMVPLRLAVRGSDDLLSARIVPEDLQSAWAWSGLCRLTMRLPVGPLTPCTREIPLPHNGRV